MPYCRSLSAVAIWLLSLVFPVCTLRTSVFYSLGADVSPNEMLYLKCFESVPPVSSRDSVLGMFDV